MSDDDLLRSALRGRGPRRPADAHATFQALQPRMRRARLHRRLVGAATATLVVGGCAGVLALGASMRSPGTDRIATVATAGSETSLLAPAGGGTSVDDAEPTAPRPPSASGAVDDAPGSDDGRALSTEPVGGTGGPVAVPDDDTGSDPRPADPEPTTTEAHETDAPPAPTEPRPATTEPEPTTEPPTTEPPTTTVPPPSTTAAPRPAESTTIDSSCGGVTVAVSGDRVELVGVDPLPDFDVDVKSAGPRDVEVGFHRRDDECEVKASVVDGRLRTTVRNP